MFENIGWIVEAKLKRSQLKTSRFVTNSQIKQQLTNDIIEPAIDSFGKYRCEYRCEL